MSLKSAAAFLPAAFQPLLPRLQQAIRCCLLHTNTMAKVLQHLSLLHGDAFIHGKWISAASKETFAVTGGCNASDTDRTPSKTDRFYP